MHCALLDHNVLSIAGSLEIITTVPDSCLLLPGLGGGRSEVRKLLRFVAGREADGEEP